VRKETIVTITSSGRDQGKTFFIKEMSALAAESWGARAVLCLAKSNPELPEDYASLGLAGLMAFGIRALAGMPWSEAKPLLDEMLSCVTVIPDPTRPQVKRQLIEDDIEEIGTLLQLRDEVINLHTGFSIAVFCSGLKGQQTATQVESSGPATGTSQG